MIRAKRLATAVIAAAAAFLPSCACNEPVEEPPKRVQTNDCLFYLTCVEIDSSNLHNAGTLPVYRRSDGYTFGQEPVAYGTMQASSSGLWSINVKFRESVVALSGRTGAHEYPVLTLAGRSRNDGKRIVSQQAAPTDVRTGVATEVRVRKISNTKLKIQPATCDRVLPYVFTFDRCQVQPRPIPIPLL
jgi:hypothetical protein